MTDYNLIGLDTTNRKGKVPGTADTGVVKGHLRVEGTLTAAILDDTSYQGTWNASTNSPTLASGVGTQGHWYLVDTAGSTTLDGTSTWVVGDSVRFNGTVWQRIQNSLLLPIGTGDDEVPLNKYLDYGTIEEALVSRGITNIKAIAFKSAEGWEKTGRQSYKTETRPAGRFLGDYANATAAWAANYQGVATVAGDYYWQTSGTLGLFECTTSNASSQRYRAGSDHMPLEACFVVSGSNTPRLRIFDLTDPLMPLWMEFITAANTAYGTVSVPDFTTNDIEWHRGRLHISDNGSSGVGYKAADFIVDTFEHRTSAQLRQFKGGLSSRNTGNGIVVVSTSSSFTLSSSNTQSIATHNGYIAVATTAGVSVIKPDGTVVRSSSTNAFKAVAILNGRLYAINDTASPEQLIDYGPIETLGASFAAVNTWTNVTVPALSSSVLNTMAASARSLVIPSASAVDQLWPSPSVQVDSLIARRGTTFATPPMKKPELMLICGTGLGSATTANNTASTFDSDGDGWTLNAPYAVWNSGAINLDRAGAGNPVDSMNRTITCRPGETVEVTFEITAANAQVTLYLDSIASGSFGSTTSLQTGTITRSFVATSSSHKIIFSAFGSASATATITSVSTTAKITDHSGKSNHATINGTLTATAEVAGGVAGLSGWSAANYLEVPYQSALDVGTGDFCYSFAFKSAGNSTSETFVNRSDPAASGARVVVYMFTDGTIDAFTTDGTPVSCVSASAYDDGLLHTVLFYRRTGVAFLEIDGQVVKSVSNARNLTNGSAVTTVGRTAAGANPATTSTIWFAGASAVAPTASEAALMHTHMRNLILSKASLDEIPSALAFNPISNAVEMVGATNRQTMKDGAITSSVAHGQGTTPAVSAGIRGEVAVGGTTGLSVSVPARNLREYQARKDTERYTVLYAGNASRTSFPDPTSAAEVLAAKGGKPVRVSNAGVVQTEGAAEDYTVKDAGVNGMFASFAVAPGSGNDVIIEFEREVWK